MDVRSAVGRYGERVAVDRLQRAGLEVLDRNWRCRGGELDLVAREGDCLVVVEVKTRRAAPASVPVCGHPAEAVTPAKATRLRRLTARWLAERADALWPGPGRRPADIRIDVVAVLRPPSGPALVEHLRAVA